MDQDFLNKASDGMNVKVGQAGSSHSLRGGLAKKVRNKDGKILGKDGKPLKARHVRFVDDASESAAIPAAAGPNVSMGGDEGFMDRDKVAPSGPTTTTTTSATSGITSDGVSLGVTSDIVGANVRGDSGDAFSSGPSISEWSADDGDIKLSTLVNKNSTACGTSVDKGNATPKDAETKPIGEVGYKNGIDQVDLNACETLDQAMHDVAVKNAEKNRGAASGQEQSCYDGVQTQFKTTGVDSSTSFASLLGANSTSSKVNFRHMINEDQVPNHDTKLPMEAMESVLGRYENTLVGYFLGKAIAFPIVQNYVTNTWKKFGVQKIMKNEAGVFLFKFSSKKGLEQLLQQGPWFIRHSPLILHKWSLNVPLTKNEVTTIPVWVKLHNVPLVAYSEVGLSLIATKVGNPVMLDSFTSSMCIDSWGRISYARALVEMSSNSEFKKEVSMAIPLADDSGYLTEIIRVEYEWIPPHCSVCKIFGHTVSECPKHEEEVVHKDSNVVNVAPTSTVEELDDGFKVVQNRKTKPKGVKISSGINMDKGPRFAPRKQVYVAKTKTPEAASVNPKGTPIATSNSFGTLEVQDDTGTPSTLVGSTNDEVKTGKSSGSTKEAGIDGSRGKDSRADIGAASKPPEIMTSSATKVSNPFSKVGNVTCSDSEEDEVLEPDNPMASFLASGGGGGFELEDFDDCADQVYDLPRHLEDMCDMYDVSLLGRGRK